jgi:acetylornithine/N-succinyldiaminopimelate aminotransferase
MTDTLDTNTNSALMQLTAKPDAVMVRGRGSYLWDEQGRRYLDFVQGWAVNSLGHCPDVVQRALAAQASELINASPAYHNRPSLDFARELTAAAGLARAFFCATGAEANEGAIKLARKWGALHKQGAHEIITLEGSFHGRTLATMAASGKPGFAERFLPKMPGFTHVAHGDIQAVARVINENTVAVMLEPIQGEAGVVCLPQGYLTELRALTRERGVLLILDEIQTGMGRTGRLFAHQQEAVTPDILTLAKGIGAGIPLAALLAEEAVSCFASGDQGGTYTQHPLTCAVGRAVLRELTSPGFMQQVVAREAELRAGLARTSQQLGLGGVRGQGLLIALDLGATIGPAVVQAAFERGLLINAPRPESLRFMPALNVSAQEIDEMLSVLHVSLEVAQRATRSQ